MLNRYTQELNKIADMLDNLGLYKDADELDYLIKASSEYVDVGKLMSMLNADLSASLPENKDLVMHLVNKNLESLRKETLKPYQPKEVEIKKLRVHPITLAENIAALWDDKINIENEMKITHKALEDTKDAQRAKELSEKLKKLTAEWEAQKRDLSVQNEYLRRLKEVSPQAYLQYLSAKESILKEKLRKQEKKPIGKREYEKGYGSATERYMETMKREEEAIEI